MAAAISLVVKDTPHDKVFYVTSPEADAINTDTALTFAGAAMGDFVGVPQIWWCQEMTPQGDTPSVKGTISIHDPTAAGFSVFKPCVAAATAFVHTFRVWMSTKRASQV